MDTRRGDSKVHKAGRPPREAVTLKEHIGRRLSAYALAAGTAGMGVLALVQPLEAEIIYSNSAFPFGGGQGEGDIDINGDGVVDFFGLGSSIGRTFNSGRSEYRRVNADFFAHTGGGIVSRPLAAGAVIGPSQHFVRGTSASRNWFVISGSARSYDTRGGPWLNKADFLGFRFTSDGQLHYGWADFSLSPFGGSFGPYAYDTVPNQSILAGQTSSTPEPGTLGLLALGSLGLGFWRRKKQEAEVSSQESEDRSRRSGVRAPSEV